MARTANITNVVMQLPHRLVICDLPKCDGVDTSSLIGAAKVFDITEKSSFEKDMFDVESDVKFNVSKSGPLRIVRCKT